MNREEIEWTRVYVDRDSGARFNVSSIVEYETYEMMDGSVHEFDKPLRRLETDEGDVCIPSVSDLSQIDLRASDGELLRLFRE